MIRDDYETYHEDLATAEGMREFPGGGSHAESAAPRTEPAHEGDDDA